MMKRTDGVNPQQMVVPTCDSVPWDRATYDDATAAILAALTAIVPERCREIVDRFIAEFVARAYARKNGML